MGKSCLPILLAALLLLRPRAFAPITANFRATRSGATCTSINVHRKVARQQRSSHAPGRIPASTINSIDEYAPLVVLYEDADMLVINKPSGMVMQYMPGSVERAVVHYLRNSNTTLTMEWPWKTADSFQGLVHRIDKETTGILVVAKHPRATAVLNASFQNRTVKKSYLAICEGLPAATRAMISFQRKPRVYNHVASVESSSLELQQLNKEIKLCGSNATRALELLNQTTLDVNGACLNTALGICKRAGERSLAMFLMDEYCNNVGGPKLIACFVKTVNLCAKEPPLAEKAIQLVERMEELCGFVHAHAASSAISACGSAGQLETALIFLQKQQLQFDDGSTTADGLEMCFRAAIRACRRCGAGNKASDLTGELKALLNNGRDRPAPLEEASASSVEESLNKEIFVDAPIGKMGSSLTPMGIVRLSDGGRSARSIVTPFAFDGNCSLARVVIETGRTHQIRVHMASVLGCPLVGDRLYNRNAGTHAAAEQCMLHAAELTVPHPTTGEMLRIWCPPPPDFEGMANKIIAGNLY